MFWSCFSYDKKGPMHICSYEKAQEHYTAEVELEAINAIREPELKAQWELQTAMRRMNIKRQPAGKKPVWKVSQKIGKWRH